MNLIQEGIINRQNKLSKPIPKIAHFFVAAILIILTLYLSGCGTHSEPPEKPAPAPPPPKKWEGSPAPVTEKPAPAPPLPIAMSAYEFFSVNDEEYGFYGLHTYVILIKHQEAGRNASFMYFLLRSTLYRSDVSPNIPVPRLNIMHIPTKDVEAAKKYISQCQDLSKGTSAFLSDHYDFNLAARKLSAFRGKCGSEFKNPNLKGPYLLTLVEKIDERNPAIEKYLFLDMSDIPTDALPEFIKAYKQQVKLSITNREKLDNFRMDVLKYLAKAAEVFPGIREAFAANVQIK